MTLRPLLPSTVSLLLGILAATATSLASTTARADSPSPSSAETFVKNGIDRFRQQDYEGARAAFREAYVRDPQASTLLDLALSELQSGHPVEGARDLRRYVRDPDARPEKVEAVRQNWLPKAEAQTGRIEVTGPDGAELLVDGTPWGRLPLRDPVDVGAGEHECVVRTGAWTRSVRVRTSLGEAVHVVINEPKPETPPPVVPSARPAPSEHAAPTTPAPQAEHPLFWTARRDVGVAAVGAGLIAVGFGFYFGQQAASDHDQAAAASAGLVGSSACYAPPRPAACAALNDANVAHNRDQTWSTVLYGVGAAGVVAGAALLLWPSSPSSAGAKGTAVTPVVGPSFAGLQITGALE